MCMCLHANGKNNINGTPGYAWNTPGSSTRPINPPDLQEGDTLLFDLPGRCGRNTDSHCHHFRIVTNSIGHRVLLVRHGGGDERIENYQLRKFLEDFDKLSEEDQYWTAANLYHLLSKIAREATERADGKWANAIVQKRVKVSRRKGVARVMIV